MKKKKFEWSKIEENYWAYYDNEELGFLEYYKKWKEWVWSQGDGIIMSKGCLKKVFEKIEELEDGN